MPSTHRNRLVTAISNAPGASGALTIAAAAAGYRTFGASDDGLSFDVSIVDGTAWEIRAGCVYTHAGTSLSRGTLEDSSTGSAIALSSAAVLTVTMSAALGNALERALQGITPGGRLTLESGVPVSTASQVAKTTIYYTPFVHDTVCLWDGLQWLPTTFSETSLALGTLTNAIPYDVFGYLSGGILTLEFLAWTDGANRATAVTLQDGRYCKSGDKTRLLLGTFYTTSTTTTEDSGANRLLANVYNKQNKRCAMSTGEQAHSYSVFTYRPFNNNTANTIKILTSASPTTASGGAKALISTGTMTIAVSVNSTTSPAAEAFTVSSGGGALSITGAMVLPIAPGLSVLTLLERASASGNLSYGGMDMEVEL